MSLTDDEKLLLLRLARRSMEAAVRGYSMDMPRNVPAALEQPQSAFVSLHQDDSLRGCVGLVLSTEPLYKTIMEAAAAAALKDPRFAPVSPGELDGLEVEISVLAPSREIRSEEIRVGIHGLVVSRGTARGLLLPQVAVERDWTALKFLEETCRKAGLSLDDWRHGAKIEAFTAEVFRERALGDEAR